MTPRLWKRWTIQVTGPYLQSRCLHPQVANRKNTESPSSDAQVNQGTMALTTSGARVRANGPGSVIKALGRTT